jgi:hypothetical protein
VASYGRAECGYECESIILVSILRFKVTPFFGYPYFPAFDSRDLELNGIRLAFEFGGQL